MRTREPFHNRIITLLSLIALLSSCSTVRQVSEEAGQTFLVTSPIGSHPVFLGVSVRLRDRDKEAAVARTSASIQAARWIRLRGEAVFYAKRTSGGTSWIQSVSIDDDYALAQELEGRLEQIDFHIDETGLYARYVLDGEQIRGLGISPRDPGGHPSWISKPPVIDGFYIGVGTASRSRLAADSIESADRDALFAVLSQLLVEIRSDRFDYVVEGQGTQTGGVNLERAKGEIEGFYVLDRYFDGDGNTYSLAVCPKP